MIEGYKKILFRLDSGSDVGLGHFVRCKALADELLKLGIQSYFATKFCHQEKAFTPYKMIKITHIKELIQNIKDTSYLAVIVDNYLTSSDELKSISQHANQLVILDDECNRGNLYADLIVNPVASAETLLAYKKYASKAQYYFGPAYILMRNEFNQVALQAYAQREKVLLTMGGADTKQLTLPILMALQKQIPNLPLVVVTGASCCEHHEIENYCLLHKIEYRHNEANMEQLFAQAKLAISAAGSTLFELAKCAVPSIFAVVADNQELAVKEHKKNGWCSYVDFRKEFNLNELIDLVKIYINDNQLDNKSKIAASCVDGQGAKRVATILSKLT